VDSANGKVRRVYRLGILTFTKAACPQTVSSPCPTRCSARGGHIDAVKYLVEKGADPNVKSHGTGATALYWAKQRHPEDHPVIEFLESIGALEAGPEL